MTKPILHVQNLSLRYGDVSILNDINFSVATGEVIGIVGPNGAGKTSLLKCIYKESQYNLGRIELFNHDLMHINRRELAQKLAVVTQHSDTVFNLSVFDVVSMGLIPHKQLFEINTSHDYKRIELALTKVDLIHKQTQAFNTLSGGEQQRCLIARAIVQQPAMLIMDEPTNHLDIFYQHQTLQLAKKLNLTLVMSIHDINLAALYCDKLLLINQGKVIAFDTPETVLTETRLKSVFKLPCLVDINPLTQRTRVSFSGQLS